MDAFTVLDELSLHKTVYNLAEESDTKRLHDVYKVAGQEKGQD